MSESGLNGLTVHGTLDQHGELVLLPLANGLGVQAPVRYPNLFATVTSSAEFVALAERFEVLRANACHGHFVYPALSAALPLPAPAVINSTLRALAEAKKAGATRLSAAQAQLAAAGLSRQLRVFSGTGFQADDLYAATAELRDLSLELPGSLSPPLEDFLRAGDRLTAAAAAAKEAGQLLLLTANDMHFALTLATPGPLLGRLNKPSWSGFYHDLMQWQARAADYLETPQERLTERLSLSRLTALCQRSSTAFIIIPDVGATALTSYLDDVYRCLGALTWRYGDARTSERNYRAPWFGDQGIPVGGTTTADGILAGLGGRTPQRPLLPPQPSRVSRAVGAGGAGPVPYSRFTEIIASAWQLLLGQATAASFHAELPSTPPLLAAAWARRSDSSSAYGLLQRYRPTRPIATGGAVIAQEDKSLLGKTVVRLSPAVPRPEAAAAKAVARKAAQASAPASLWLRLIDLERVSQLHPAVPLGKAAAAELVPQPAVLWPQAELWQTVDMVKTLSAFPGIFLTPEVLRQGFATLSPAEWESLSWPEDGILRGLTAGRPWPFVLAWFTGCSPWPPKATEAAKRALYQDEHSASWDMHRVAAGLTAGLVRLNVRYSVVGTGDELDAKLQLAQVLQGLQNARTVPQELSAAFASLGDSLRFAARPYFEVDGVAVSESDWFAATKTGTHYLRLPSGQAIDAAVYAEKSEQFILRQKVYAKYADMSFNQLWQVHQQAVASSAVNILPEEYVQQLSLSVAPVLARLDAALATPVAAMLRAGPLAKLAPQLRSYQEEGVAWTFLRLQIGLGVCLADEMGLGKTVQAVALILALRHPTKPTLVVMPKSVLINWQRELARFAPELSVAVVQETVPPAPADVWLVTYPRLRLGSDWLRDQEFQLVVLDEAQAIKNMSSQTAEAAAQLQTIYRLALSGTPVENHAGELWSLVNWLNPGYLGRAADFLIYIKLARSAEQKRLLLAPLRACLEPLLLRRTKNDPAVQLGLPAKTLQDRACELSTEQIALYEALIEVILAEEVTGLPAVVRRALFLKAILHAKQICIHPELFYGDDESAAAVNDKLRFKAMLQARGLNLAAQVASGDGAWLQRSGKLIALAELLSELRPTSRGILIFTQYLGAAKIVQRVLRQVSRSDGPEASGMVAEAPLLSGSLSVEARQALVDDFNDASLSRRGEAPVLILSLKAGGSGLNLTGADRVIHLDRWWNPAVEDQASDRAHRLGQDLPVFIHTLTSTGTIEEAIGLIFNQKRELAGDLLGGGDGPAMGEQLESRDGFLGLMDPRQIFAKRMQQAGSAAFSGKKPR